MRSETMAMPRGWGEEHYPMALRLVTAGDHPDLLDGATKAPGAGIVVGVFSGSMFWLGLAIGWTLWG
jgi:hypothetical protein